MKLRLSIATAALAAVFVFPATGIGSDLDGFLTVNRKAIQLRYVNALLHDNAEGMLDTPQLRILVTDTETPIDALHGIRFLPVIDLQLERKWQGILLQFDPERAGDVDLTVLGPSGRQTVTNKIKITDLKVAEDTVGGIFEFADDDTFLTPAGPDPIVPVVKFRFRFTCPLHKQPPVTSDLNGQAAIGSPQVKTLKAIADAIARNDLDDLQKLTTERADRRNRRQVEREGTSAHAIYRRVGAELKKQISKVRRVVIRGNTAVVILGANGWYEFVLVGGAWKGD